MKVYFIRHGETQWNKDKRLNGLTDVALNEVGKEQALKTGEYLKLETKCTKIISSPLSRALETAKYINNFYNVEVEIDKRLIERDYKEWEGKKIDEINFNEIEDELEPHMKVTYRIIKFLRDLIKKSDDKDVIFVVTHGVILRHIFTIIKEQGYIQDNFLNLSINSAEYGFETKKWRILEYNFNKHIAK